MRVVLVDVCAVDEEGEGDKCLGADFADKYDADDDDCDWITRPK